MGKRTVDTKKGGGNYELDVVKRMIFVRDLGRVVIWGVGVGIVFFSGSHMVMSLEFG